MGRYNDTMTQYNAGDKVIIVERGPFMNMEAIVVEPAQTTIKGAGFDLDVPEEHQSVQVKIMGNLNIFVHARNLKPA